MSVEKAALCQPADEKSVPPHLRCNSCSKPVFNSYQTPHGCRLCQTCVSTKLHPSEKRQCPGTTEACRDKQEEVIINQGFCLPDIAARREISKLTVTCPNKDDGCKDQFKWRDVDTHLEKCDFEKVRPELTRSGPSIRLTEKFGEDFLRQSVRCNLCSERIVLSEMWTSHKNLNSSKCCSKYIDFCPHCKDKGTQLNRGTYAEHMKACPEKLNCCKYAHIGCNKNARHSDLEKHYKEDADHHISLMDNRLRELQTAGDNAEIGIVKTKLDSLHEQFMQLRVEVFDRTLSTHDMAKIFTELFGGIPQTRSFLQTLRDKLNELQSAMTETDSRVVMAHSFEIDNEKTIRQKLHQLELRLQNAEHSQTTFAERVLVWKVNNLNKRKCEAVDGRAVSIFSQPLFLRRNGFMFRVRLFLNGSESGVGTHVSVYLVLMQHEFDDIQVWPVRADVTFKLLNLRNRSADITKTVRFDSGNRRPSSREDLSVCCGEPNFCSRDKLESLPSPFVKNDALFLEVEVADIRIRHGK